MLSFHGYDIVFQEVPNEVSLAIEVGGCPFQCAGCHSPHMREDGPHSLTNDVWELIDKYKNFITCICFMGGDHELSEFARLLEDISTDYPDLKLCLYTGRDSLSELTKSGVMQYLSYVKYGPYNAELGGLDSPTTNQKFFKVRRGRTTTDMTNYFQKKGLKS